MVAMKIKWVNTYEVLRTMSKKCSKYLIKMEVLVAQSCLTRCSPTDCSLPGSSPHGILQARLLEWVIIPSSRGSSQPRDQIPVSCIVGRFFNL